MIIGGVLFGYLAGIHLLVPQGLRLQARPHLGAGVVLVLGDRLLPRLHAALRARLHGHAAPHGALRRPVVAALPDGRRARAPSSSCSASSAMVMQLVVSDPRPRRDCATSPAIRGTAARSNGRPPRRRRPTISPFTPEVARPRRLARHEGARRRLPAAGRLRGHPTCRRTSPVGVILGGLRLRARLRHDLAHLVAGDRLRARHVGRHDLRARPTTTREFTLSRRRGEAHRGRALPRPRERRRATHGRRRHRRCRPSRVAKRRRPTSSGRFGFWLYLMSDAVIFALLFATYGVMVGNTAGGPDGQGSVRPATNAALETALLLVSSTTFGFAIAVVRRRGNRGAVLAWLAVTFLLGAGFVFLEIREFAGMIARRRRPRPQRLPVGLLHPGRHPRPARQLRPDLDPDPVRPGHDQGPHRCR